MREFLRRAHLRARYVRSAWRVCRAPARIKRRGAREATCRSTNSRAIIHQHLSVAVCWRDWASVARPLPERRREPKGSWRRRPRLYSGLGMQPSTSAAWGMGLARGSRWHRREAGSICPIRPANGDAEFKLWKTVDCVVVGYRRRARTRGASAAGALRRGGSRLNYHRSCRIYEDAAEIGRLLEPAVGGRRGFH